jgi:xanthine dehydrogenase YagS FAD-binding subunit
MRPFSYARPDTVETAIRNYAAAPDTCYIGGGTNLIDLMKMNVERPAHLVDVSRLPLKSIEVRNGGLRIGAMASNSDCANHPLVRTRYPLLSRAILGGASQQLRNKATMGGNLLQRTRCYYFYDPTLGVCNKRNPGTGCSAKEGLNRMHAILGASEECIAVNPSDMCVALAALDAVVQVSGPQGAREIPFRDFHRLPGDKPQLDTNLHPGELITAIDLPALPYAKRSTYLKIRDRNSYAFALVSVAAIVDTAEDGAIRHAHIALGGVAHKPWRATSTERALEGKKVEPATLRAAAEVELRDARPYHDNAFKVELAKRAIVRAIQVAGAPAREQA